MKIPFLCRAHFLTLTLPRFFSLAFILSLQYLSVPCLSFVSLYLLSNLAHSCFITISDLIFSGNSASPLVTFVLSPSNLSSYLVIIRSYHLFTVSQHGIGLKGYSSHPVRYLFWNWKCNWSFGLSFRKIFSRHPAAWQYYHRVLHRVLAWLAFENFHHIICNSNAAAVDSSLQLSIFA